MLGTFDGGPAEARPHPTPYLVPHEISVTTGARSVATAPVADANRLGACEEPLHGGAVVADKDGEPTLCPRTRHIPARSRVPGKCDRCRAPAKKRWCSNACKCAAYYERRSGKPRSWECRHCSGEMWHYRVDAQYCGASCRVAACRSARKQVPRDCRSAPVGSPHGETAVLE